LEALIGFAIIVAWTYWIIESIIKDKFNIEVKKGWRYEYTNKLHKWIDRLLMISAMIFLSYFLFYDTTRSTDGEFFIIFVFFALLLVILRVSIEWKFARKSKKYILTLLSGIFSIIFLIGIVGLTPTVPDNTGILYTENGEIKYEYIGLNTRNTAIFITGYSGEDTKIIIPSEISGVSVVLIENSSFTGIASLKSIKIPDNVVIIGENAFRDNINLSTVYFASKIPPIIEEGAFANINPDAKAIIPAGTIYWPPEGTNWYGLIITYANGK